MITRFLQMWTTNRRARLSRAIASACVVLWIAGSVSTLYGGLAPQWTTPHCPQSHSNAAHHLHGSCAWHCDSLDSQSSFGRSWRPFIAPTRFVSGHLRARSCAPTLNGGLITRGPPHSIVYRLVSAMLRGKEFREEAHTNSSGRMHA